MWNAELSGSSVQREFLLFLEPPTLLHGTWSFCLSVLPVIMSSFGTIMRDMPAIGVGRGSECERRYKFACWCAIFLMRHVS